MSESTDPYLFDLEGIVEADWPPLAVRDKMAEATFFLGHMRQTTDWAQFRWLTSACLEACRAAMDWMAYQAHHQYFQDDEGNDRLDEEYVSAVTAALSQYFVTERGSSTRVNIKTIIHPLLREMARHRKETAHYGPLWIVPEKVSSPEEFKFKEGERSVIHFCDEVLDLLATISQEAHEATY